MRIAGLVSGAALVAVALGLGCADSPTQPASGGAGLRVQLPAGADTLDWVRVELWDDNVTVPDGCISFSAEGSGIVSPSVQPPDTCTRMEVYIRNYINELVRSEPDTTAFKGGLSFPWDGLDDDGEPVPSGYYPVFARCLDSAGEFTFTGHYFNWASREYGACQWPLWIDEVARVPSNRVLEYEPFPLVASHQTFDKSGIPETLVSFVNPFLVRVRAPGMQTFQVEVTLVEGEFSQVSVEFVPTS